MAGAPACQAADLHSIARSGEIKCDGATGIYLASDRAGSMFFVLIENAPSGRMHIIATVKKTIHDAFEKRCCKNHR